MKGFKSPQIIILFGRSGSGKGTQADLLRKKFRFEILTTGDFLRELTKKKNYTGRKLKQILAKGGLAPWWLASLAWLEYFVDLNRPKNLILDGSPRSLPEAKLLDEVFAWYGYQTKVFLIDISEKEAFFRLTKRRICQKCGRLIPYVGKYKDLKVCDKCGGKLVQRSDDHPKAIQARLDYFKKSVMPVIRYYQRQGRLIRINGEQSIEDVHQEILKYLK